MSNSIYPDIAGQSITLHRQPEWATLTKEAYSGVETTIAQRPWPRWRYTIQYDVLRQTVGDISTLLAFYNSMYGSYDDFLFTDPDYNSVTTQQFGVGDGSTTVFQLCRPIGTWIEPVWAPNSVTVYQAGVELTAGTDYTVGTTGQIQMTTAPTSGTVLTWTGTYYMRCRFADDKIDLERMLWRLWKAGKVELISKVYPT